VVDNASKDGTVKMVREHFPDVSLIVNDENRGFAAANNQAVRLAKGRHVIFQNPDTIVLGEALQTMVQFMDRHPEAGAVGCKLLNADGSVQFSTKRLLTSSIILYHNTILGRLPFLRGKLKNYKMNNFSFDRLEEVDAASGAALMVRKSVLDEVGLMDEGYFMFFEEMDLCRRVRLKGYKIYFVPTALIIHFGGASRHQNENELVMVGEKSVMRYVGKFESKKRLLLFKLLYKPLFAAGVIHNLFFDFLYFLKYRTIKKDPQKLRKRSMKIQRGLYFLKRDLGYFIFRL
jgi:GT2 family glycosyltransferase